MKAFRVTVPPGDEDLAVALLWEAGTSGVQVSPPGGEDVLLAYFEGEAATVDSVRGALGAIASTAVEEVEVPDVDWVARFREGFRAFRVGSFHIVPAWDQAAPEDARRLVVDPGQAFGTGTHESTRLSLSALEAITAVRAPARVLDVGTGSGILSIAALLLGARMAVGIEIDPDALPAARDHAALNGVALRLVRADGARCMRPGAFDLVLANISAPLLVKRAQELMAACRPGGHVVAAGLLRLDVAEVRAAFEPFAEAIHVRTEGDWGALVVRRPA
jgi:ribosomal protein L11 methyltransferase